MQHMQISVAILLLNIPLCGPAVAATVSSDVDVTISIDAAKVVQRISPYVYGVNFNNWSKMPHTPFTRQGGNRMTAWNWETNASNAGNDWHHQNDNYLGGGEKVGEVARSLLAPAMQRGRAALVTIPMAGYVAADKLGGGDVNKTPDYLEKRFFRSISRKGKPFSDPPDLGDRAVCQDEFVWWINKQFPPAARKNGQIFYALDNEPDLWSSTHARIHPKPVTYAEIVERTRDLASAIKDVDKKATIFGFVSYGYAGYMNLQNAPDARGRDFIDFFLDSMRDLEKQHGRRLVDVLDLHWYSEVYASGKRITEATTDAQSVRARVQAPRSLWDPTFRENSWIDRDVVRQPIQLLPRINEKIARHYPGTKLAFTEYHYGADKHISGAIAEADVLGIFGREGVFAAAIWGGGDYTFAAFDCYLNFDGEGGHFGDLALHAATSRIEEVSVYASKSEADAKRLTVVLINRSEQPRRCQLNVSGFPFTEASLYRLSGEQPKVSTAGKIAARPGSVLTLPAMTVTTVVLR